MTLLMCVLQLCLKLDFDEFCRLHFMPITAIMALFRESLIKTTPQRFTMRIKSACLICGVFGQKRLEFSYTSPIVATLGQLLLSLKRYKSEVSNWE